MKEYDAYLDITQSVCPITFVKVKAALDELSDGQILWVNMNDGQPIKNIPKSLEEEGHRVIKTEKCHDGTYDLYAVKNGLK
jgi:TusA-related sulfurtransferase